LSPKYSHIDWIKNILQVGMKELYLELFEAHFCALTKPK